MRYYSNKHPLNIWIRMSNSTDSTEVETRIFRMEDYLDFRV